MIPNTYTQSLGYFIMKNSIEFHFQNRITDIRKKSIKIIIILYYS